MASGTMATDAVPADERSPLQYAADLYRGPVGVDDFGNDQQLANLLAEMDPENAGHIVMQLPVAIAADLTDQLATIAREHDRRAENVRQLRAHVANSATRAFDVAMNADSIAPQKLRGSLGGLAG